MRILVLGAGGIGGYFGARMQAAGGDITFLVRPARAAQLRADGLNISSAFGDLQLKPKVLTREELRQAFDVIIVSCKAYDLDSAMDAIAPAVGEHSVILPLLNGVSHIATLAARFGAQRVLGGVALISAMLAPGGEVKHLNKMHRIVIGTLSTPPSPWLQPLVDLLSATAIDFTHSDNIEQAMWDKIVFLSSLAGATCTLRASIGDILITVAGEDFINGLLADCARIAQESGHAVTDAQLSGYRKLLTEKGSALVASMLRDVERGGATEADHILGDLVGRAQAKGLDAPWLKLAYSHLQAYDLRRQRGAAI